MSWLRNRNLYLDRVWRRSPCIGSNPSVGCRFLPCGLWNGFKIRVDSMELAGVCWVLYWSASVTPHFKSIWNTSPMKPGLKHAFRKFHTFQLSIVIHKDSTNAALRSCPKYLLLQSSTVAIPQLVAFGDVFEHWRMRFCTELPRSKLNNSSTVKSLCWALWSARWRHKLERPVRNIPLSL